MRRHSSVYPPLREMPQGVQRRWPRWLSGSLPLWGASLPALLFFALPLVALVLRISPTALLSRITNQAVSQAISLSIFTTLVTTALVIICGTPLAYLLARRRFPGRIAVDVLVDLVMVLPPAVAGIALLVAFGRRGLLGQSLHAVGIDLAFTTLAVVLAQAFVAGPFYLRTAITALGHVQHEVEEAAAIDGATTWQIFWRITLPLTLPSLFAGAIMTWARALGEFGATIIFAGNFPGKTQTVPLAIYLGFELDLQTALVLAGVLLAVAFSVLLVVRLILRRQIVAS